MKKSIIWLLTIVMSLTFGTLLYFQIMYLENMVRMRESQFSENAMRSIYATANFLERQETLYYLEQDANTLDSSVYDEFSEGSSGLVYPGSVVPRGIVILGGTEKNLFAGDKQATNFDLTGHGLLQKTDPTGGVGARYSNLQEVIRNQYLYQRSLLNDVILTILRDAGKRPLVERADSTLINDYLAAELKNNGLDVPFKVAIADKDGSIVYETSGYDETNTEIYSTTLFPHNDSRYVLSVKFPTKHNYIISSVRFIIPTLAFTLILLVVFIFTIMLAFRQKKLTEIKTDFINNMTHELKTPISTISLAGQMLSDDSVRKSPANLKHLAEIVTEESKRLRFLVDKVLQMSVFDNSSAALNFTEVDANEVITGVINNIRIRVEKYGGKIDFHPDASDAIVWVDKMQFTNVIANLLDNAVKYKREDTEPELVVSTSKEGTDKLRIKVQDNGIGMKKDDLKKIFEKFYRVSTGNRHDVKGFGLGLPYVKKMVTAFKGTISVESELGKGTTFIIILPLFDENDSENK